MKKRFTDCDKWRDPWFRRLSARAKLAWQWLLDNCDAAGVIDADWELASFQIGEEVSESILSELGDRIAVLPSGKLFIEKFVLFQCGALSRSCKAHKPIFESLEKNGLRKALDTLSEGFGKGSMEGPRKRKGKGNRIPFASESDERSENDDRSGPSRPSLETVVEFAKGLPCAEECAKMYHADRSSTNWQKVKGGIQVEIDDWRNDLRIYATHWRAFEHRDKMRDQGKVAKAVDTRPTKTLKL